MVLDIIFPTDIGKVGGFLELFVNVFISIALVEEAFKWLVVKFFGYNNREFDELYDIIVYSVFSSLGFACIENVLYVIQSGLGTAINRAIFSIPGHMCFGVLMGFFLSKAKISGLNDKAMSKRNLVLSLIVPSLFHAVYDALLFNGSIGSILIFLLFYIIMLIICICVIISVSNVHNNVKLNVAKGVIVKKETGVEIKPEEKPVERYNYCPICGKASNGANFCAGCGMKLTK